MASNYWTNYRVYYRLRQQPVGLMSIFLLLIVLQLTTMLPSHLQRSRQGGFFMDASICLILLAYQFVVSGNGRGHKAGEFYRS